MAHPLLCGFGTADITPRGKVYLNGQFYRRTGDNVHDALNATALALSDGGAEPAVWLSVDLVSIDETTLRSVASAVAASVPGFKREQLLCSATHTHTGPFIRSDYDVRFWGESYRITSMPSDCVSPESYRDEVFIPRAAAACVGALSSMRPALFAPGLGRASIGHPRRVVYRDGSSVMYGATDRYEFDELEGCSDDSVEALCFFEPDGERRLAGLLLNVACPAQVLEHHSYYSADYVGAFRMRLNKACGRAVPVVMTIGAAGNQSPRDLIRKRGRVCRGEASMFEWEGADELGRRLLSAVDDIVGKAREECRGDCGFSHEFFRMPVALRRVTQSEVDEAKAAYQKYLDKYNGDERSFSDRDRQDSSWHAGVINRGRLLEKSSDYDAPVHILRLGDAAAVTNPFELYNEYGNRIRARSDCTHTIIAELTDDAAGYLPTAFAVRAKSYSAMVSNCLCDCAGAEDYCETVIKKINGDQANNRS